MPSTQADLIALACSAYLILYNDNSTMSEETAEIDMNGAESERKSDNQPFYSYADPMDDRAESLPSFTESAVYKLRQQNLSSYSLPSDATNANLISTRLDTPYSNRGDNGLMFAITNSKGS